MPTTSFLASFPVNPADPANDPILRDMQGNILKGHGRDFTFNLFLSFKPGQQHDVQVWIANFASVFVTSARKQLDETQLFHDKKIPGGLFTSLFLSAEGYKYLGVPAAKVPKETNAATSFANGMKASAGALSDKLSDWEPTLRGDAGIIHAMVLVADDDVHLARAMARAVKLSLASEADVVDIERGVVLRNAKGDGIEHNNYVDGISQPVFFQSTPPPPVDKWDPSATPALMLVADPGGKDANSLGSYFVFRKLEQNVQGFKANEKQMAISLFNLPATPATWTDAQKDQAEIAGAMLVGRFEGGTPVLLNRVDENPGPEHQENNFNYAEPGSEFRCPFQAHIRKSGPRTDVGGVAFNKTKQLVRRGIPFENAPRVRDADGQLSDKAADQPLGGVGLLFMCYVANIKDQFEFVQQSWVNSPGFAQGGTGKDPLIGQPAAGPAGTVYQWPPVWGNPSFAKKPAAFHDFITMRGGEYFFAPSLSMLKNLRPLAAPGPLPVPGPVPLPFPFPLPRVVIDPVLQLFVPDQADAGAGIS